MKLNERMKDANAAMTLLIAQLVEHCTGNAKVVGSNPVQSLKGHFSSSVMAAFASFILSLNCYCWTPIIIEFSEIKVNLAAQEAPTLWTCVH